METDIRDRQIVLLTRPQVEALCGLSTSSIYRFMREGLFPEPIRVGRRAVRWPASEIDEWLATRPAPPATAPPHRPPERQESWACCLPKVRRLENSTSLL